MNKVVDYRFKRKRLNEFSELKILCELEKAAEHFNYIEFGRRDFDKVANISSSVVRSRFNGSWTKSLEALKKQLQQKGLSLSPRLHAPNRIFSDKQLFNEMERVWQDVGQRPSRAEWEAAQPRISYNTYKQRFGGWTNACMKFIEHKMGGSILVDNEPHVGVKKIHRSETKNSGKDNAILSRSVTLSVRLKVLERDAYRCIFCGRSPATDVGVRLHIDHRFPFSKGGSSTIDNLQTLCQDCNLGKSDKS